MLTEFHRIPDDFVTRYDAELGQWAANFRDWGPVVQVRLRGPVRGVPPWDGNGEEPLVAVRLKAVVEVGRIVVQPVGEVSEDLIRRHVEALRH